MIIIDRTNNALIFGLGIMTGLLLVLIAAFLRAWVYDLIEEEIHKRLMQQNLDKLFNSDKIQSRR